MKRQYDSFKRTEEDDGVNLYDVAVIKETDAAILVQLGDDHKKREVWIPKSQVLEDSDVQGGTDMGVLTITTWFAEKEDLG